MVVLYALLFQKTMKEIEQQERFPAPSAAGNNLHKTISPSCSKHVHIILPWYNHLYRKFL